MGERLEAGPAFSDTVGRVFTTEVGGRIHPDTLSKRFLQHVAAVPTLPRLSFHGLRHTHATLLLKAGVTPRVVQERLGHQDVTVTLGIYGHVIKGQDSEAASTAAELVAPEGM